MPGARDQGGNGQFLYYFPEVGGQVRADFVFFNNKKHAHWACAWQALSHCDSDSESGPVSISNTHTHTHTHTHTYTRTRSRYCTRGATKSARMVTLSSAPARPLVKFKILWPSLSSTRTVSYPPSPPPRPSSSPTSSYMRSLVSSLSRSLARALSLSLAVSLSRAVSPTPSHLHLLLRCGRRPAQGLQGRRAKLDRCRPC